MTKGLKKYLALILIMSMICSNSVLASTIESSSGEESNTPIINEEKDVQEVNRDTLLVLMDEASTKLESQYTEETWQTFLDIYNMCLALLEDKETDAGQETIDEAVIQLQAAMGGLEQVELTEYTDKETVKDQSNDNNEIKNNESIEDIPKSEDTEVEATKPDAVDGETVPEAEQGEADEESTEDIPKSEDTEVEATKPEVVDGETVPEVTQGEADEESAEDSAKSEDTEVEATKPEAVDGDTLPEAEQGEVDEESTEGIPKSEESAIEVTEEIQSSVAQESDVNVIDLSHEKPNPWGGSFAIKADACYRWQMFEAPKDGVLDTLEVYLIKVNEDKEGLPEKVLVSFYQVTETGLGEQLYSGEISSTMVKSKDITTIPVSVEVKKGQKYAVALSGQPLGVQDNDHARYDWASKDIGLNDQYKAGKINPDNQVVDETKYVNTYWTKLHYEKPASEPIDYSFQGKRTWGFSFGVTDAVNRWQTFTSNVDDRMSSVEVYLIKKNQFGLDFPNLVVSLYEVENNLPSKVLTQVTKPSGEIETNGVTQIEITYDLVKDKQYAIVLTTDDVQNEDASVATCYDWPTSDRNLAGIEFFGKAKGDSFIDESNLNTGYLKINFGDSGPVVSKPTSMEVTTKKTILDVNDQTQVNTIVKDQFGAVMDDVVITYSSSDENIATVTNDGKVTAHSGGIAKITATCKGVSEYVTITVKDGQGLIIPVPGMVIEEDMVFKPGVYNFEGASKGLVIQGDNITVDGTGVTIYNAPEDQILEDVTTGAYAYKLNPVSNKVSYHMTRHIDLRKTSKVLFSFDAKATAYVGKLKVQVKDESWKDVYTVDSLNGEWSKHEVNLDTYAGKEIDLRITYDGENQQKSSLENMGLLLDTLELFEDDVRTFSDLAEAKVFYLWNLSYDDENTVEDTLKDKPFDRTSYNVNTGLFKGTAITVEDQNNVTIKGFKVHGFYYALEGKNCDGLVITHNDFSNNYTDPNGGWGDQNGGAVVLNNCNNGEITHNKATNNANGLYLKYSNNNEIRDNNFSVCSDVCLELWNSSYNTIVDNDFSWGIRIDPLNEVHARDSTSSLIEAGSNYNFVKNNDFTHGGDGIFIRALNGFVSEGNVFEKNDTSFANNNAVESGMGRNYYINNKANYSSYGFWMGGSDESVMIGNEIAYNGIKPANAPENFGNAGISMKYWSSEHMVIVNNYIHDNKGTGIGMSNKKVQPSYHALIQNNRIENNTRYAIHLDHAQWFEINGNSMTGNGYNNQIYKTSNASNIIQREGATYIDSYEEYLKQVPQAKITCNVSRYRVGEAISFSAEESADPNNDSLSYRWDMGDGTILTGETVNYIFKEPGFHDVAVTVTDGSWSDIDWINVNVVGDGNEIGTDESASKWDVTTHSGKTEIANAYANMAIPNVGDSNLVDYPIYYVVEGQKSIKMHTTSANNTLTYPKTKDAALDLSNDTGISFSMKIQNQNRDGSRSPIVTLYTDDNNYLRFTPTETLLSPFKYVDFTQMQYRHEWVAAVIPFEGSSLWIREEQGNPDLSQINYITFNTVTGGTLGLDFWLDGLKTIPKGAEPYRGVNIARDGEVVTSSSNAASKDHAPLNKELIPEEYWLSNLEDISHYGVTFNTPRYVNQVDFHVYYKPTGNSNDTIGLPSNPVLEIKENGVWTKVDSRELTIVPDKNVLTFNTKKVEGIRLKLNNSQGKLCALYGFRAYDSSNILGELSASTEPVTIVESDVTANKVLQSVDMYICLDKPSAFPQQYTDFKVYLYDVSEDGKGPKGAALASGTLPVGDIVSGGLNKAYNISMSKKDGSKFELEAGKRYVLGATQQEVFNGGDTCYRWPVSKISSASSEDFGKFVSDADGLVKSFGAESHLGTGWMILHTDQDEAGKPFLDYSYNLSHSTGFGVGHKGEDGRYQSFTMPINKVYDIIDGAYHNDAMWIGKGNVGTEHAIDLTLKESKTFNELGIYFEKLPQELKILVNDSVIGQVYSEQLEIGYNTLSLPTTHANKIKLLLINGNSNTEIKEIELRKIEIPQCTVSFNSNGGSALAPMVVEKGTLINNLGMPSRSGYSFLGWYKDGVKVELPLQVLANMTLDAYWNKIATNDTSSSSSTVVTNYAPVQKVNVTMDNKGNKGEVTGTMKRQSNIVDNKSKLTMSQGTMSKLIKTTLKSVNQEKSNKANIIVEATLPKGKASKNVNESMVSMPKKALEEMTSSDVQVSLSTKMPFGEISFDQEALKSIYAQAEGNNIDISIEQVDVSQLSSEVQRKVENRPVYDLEVSAKEIISDFKLGQVKVTLPYALKEGEKAEGTIIYYVDKSGKLHTVINCIYDAESKSVSFMTNHFSKYMISNNSNSFKDIDSHWAEKNINFVASHGLFLGTSQDRFSPEQPITAGMFLTVLGRMEGVESKLTGNQYYKEYVQWAQEQSLCSQIDPEGNITREDVMIILYNYLMNKGYLNNDESNIDAYRDDEKISHAAREAVYGLTSYGIVKGDTEGNVNPCNPLTRSELSTVLYQVIDKIVSK